MAGLLKGIKLKGSLLGLALSGHCPRGDSQRIGSASIMASARLEIQSVTAIPCWAPCNRKVLNTTPTIGLSYTAAAKTSSKPKNTPSRLPPVEYSDSD
ncbi:hypothetical protein AVEN_35625-1 [Araneus ventricosus]|uniref:Uncharacterized protein n=1 Tax=Araneus ventricosus TaxID=182803 RepID=A0A4Y2T1S3_ARAVE|nr:hypothetical protein AVEN_35625-1 [Araneus ventricosus]